MLLMGRRSPASYHAILQIHRDLLRDQPSRNPNKAVRVLVGH